MTIPGERVPVSRARYVPPAGGHLHALNGIEGCVMCQGFRGLDWPQGGPGRCSTTPSSRVILESIEAGGTYRTYRAGGNPRMGIRYR